MDRYSNSTDATRRSLLIGSAGLLGSLTSPSWAAPKPAKGGGEPMLWDVVIVGAGLAGLNAAYLLESQGLKVQVVEASDRVGGRLRTARKDDFRAELGGSEVGTLYGRVRDALTRYDVGIAAEGQKATPYVLNMGGRMIRGEDWATAPENHTVGAERNILPYLIQNRLFFDWIPFDETTKWNQPDAMQYDVSAAQFMRMKGVSEAAIRLSDLDVNGPSLASLSALSIFRDLVRAKTEGYTNPNKPQYGVGTHLERAFIKGGSDMLPKAMAAGLKSQVKLNSPVVSIDQTDKEVETRLADGTRLRSRYMVMAAPFAAVRNILFKPGLTGPQLDAVMGAVYSATTQFHFRINAPFWDVDGLPPSIWSDSIFERTFVVSNGGGPHGSLIVWLNGDGATRLGMMPLEAQRDAVLAELNRLRPSTTGKLDYMFGYSWEANRFVGGNKHCFAAGQIKRFANEMGKPHGRIHFAGEHLRRLEHGMESAMETSEIAAFEVLERG